MPTEPFLGVQKKWSEKRKPKGDFGCATLAILYEMLLKSLIVNSSFGRASINTLQRAYLSLKKKMFEIEWKLYIVKVNPKPTHKVC